MKPRNILAALATVASALLAPAAVAETLTLSSWVPPTHYLQKDIIEPWIADVAKATEGRVTVKILPKPVGSPPQHWELARKGVADITWTVLGYTPGRFVKTEVFEIPFIAPSGPNAGEITSKAVWEYVDKYAGDEFKDVKLIAVHAHGPGVFHTKQAVTGLETLRGMKIRGGTRIVNNMLVKLGATRQEVDETLGVTTYMGGGPSIMYAANAIAAFDEFMRASATKAA